MHKILEDEGSFNFVYQIPQILYSCLISAVLNSLIKLLSISEYKIIEFKKIRQIRDLEIKKSKLESYLHCKFIIFFIMAFVFKLFFLYYLSSFCAIYRNTQIHLIKDTVISFGLSLLYPFIIYLFPGMFRIPALSNPEAKRKCLYNFSKLLQML